jgi:hypothetical protein
MKEKDAIKKYGKEMWQKMLDTGWLDGITVVLCDDGEIDIPESDIEIALKAISGTKIKWYEFD